MENKEKDKEAQDKELEIQNKLVEEQMILHPEIYNKKNGEN